MLGNKKDAENVIEALPGEENRRKLRAKKRRIYCRTGDVAAGYQKNNSNSVKGANFPHRMPVVVNRSVIAAS